jgi:hypothetical protein
MARRHAPAPSLWYVIAPGQWPAYSFRASSAKEARAAFRHWAGLSRCPRGLAIWPA